MRLDALRERLSRRSVLVTGGIGAGAAFILAGLSLTKRATGEKAFIAAIDYSKLRDLGGGFYEADGWVLSRDDLELAGRKPPEGKPDVY
ncbi:MAG: hypothetical protein R3C60_03370 [Parvularculaceae bacterium]